MHAEPAIEPAAAGTAPEPPRFVACVGAKGGCGATLIATHLAASRARDAAGAARICLADLDFSKGDVAGALDLAPARTLHEVLVDPHRLGEDVLRGTAVTHASGLAVLAQPASLAQAMQIGVAEVDLLVSALRAAFGLTIADCGSRLDEVAAATAMRADLIVLVATPAIGALRDAGRALDLLRGVEIDPGRIRLVINQVPARGAVDVDEIGALLGVPVAATVSRDDDACARAERTGTLLWEAAGRARPASELRLLWDRLTRPGSPAAPRGFHWARLLGRAS